MLVLPYVKWGSWIFKDACKGFWVYGYIFGGIACCAQPRRWPVFRCPLKLQMSGDSLGPLRRPGFPQKRRFGAEFL